jgi:putative intracellular protease/amidase
VLVYIPPYNVEHLRELGLLEGSRLAETIARVREVAERHGARFHDAHDLLGDAYFRDATDHTFDSGEWNGHQALAAELARAMADDWERILARDR